MSEAEREVILLRHFSDMSFRQIAEVMGTPLGTALARAHRGLNRLRELMDGGP
jgi:RNA polymerase sigma-70 factor (ECF subfamily)